VAGEGKIRGKLPSFEFHRTSFINASYVVAKPFCLLFVRPKAGNQAYLLAEFYFIAGQIINTQIMLYCKPV
jgi:hypothetical protein